MIATGSIIIEVFAHIALLWLVLGYQPTGNMYAIASVKPELVEWAGQNS